MSQVWDPRLETSGESKSDFGFEVSPLPPGPETYSRVFPKVDHSVNVARIVFVEYILLDH